MTIAEFGCIQPEKSGFGVYEELLSWMKGEMGDSERVFACKHSKGWLKCATFVRVKLVVCIVYEMLFLENTGNEVGLGLLQQICE